jgi:ABC-type sugar transport system ATPase subunit
VLVFDEPTSSLGGEDAQRLFALIRRLRERGTAIVYISHALEEVFALCDRYTVLRDGRSVAGGAVAGAEIDAIVAAMVGRASPSSSRARRRGRARSSRASRAWRGPSCRARRRSRSAAARCSASPA